MIINSLAENDMDTLDTFLKHEGFKNQAIEKLLIRYLIKNRSSKKWLEKEVVLNELFADEPKITVDRLKHYSAKALKIINRFLVYSYAVSNPLMGNSILMDYYVEKGLTGKMTKGLLKQMEGHLDENRDYYHHYNKFKINQWRAIFEKVEEKDTTAYLQQCSDNLDAFYIENKLRIYVEIQAKRVDARSEFDDFLMALVPVYESEMHTKNEVADVFHFIYDALLNEEHGGMDDLIEKIVSGGYPKFGRFLEKSVLGYLINYCITQINSRNPEYAEKYIKINNHLKDKGVFLDSNRISWQRYKNMITALLIDKKDLWQVREFIDTYKAHLPDNFREQAEILAHTLFRHTFDNKVSEKSLHELGQFKPKDTIGRISFDRLLIKLYYETDDKEQLTLLIQRLRKFISRKKNESGKKAMSELMYLRVKGFIDIVSKMMKEKTVSLVALENTTLYGVDYLWLRKHLK